MKLKLAIFFVLAFGLSGIINAQETHLNILVFSKTGAFHHKSIPTGVKFLSELGKKNHWKMDFTENSNDFNDENLKLYNVLVFLNTSGDFLNSDEKNAEALGLDKDPKNVFSFEDINGEHVLHISGEIYGSITSKQEYENYHLKLQFKWGENVWEPRLLRNRDSGILYYCYGSYRKFWNVWMAS
ncbi:ThuA domain-containing protein [Formosa sp. PL04]|uniref:ThuA domain-containing protein n=1 Tax=Formosa sp. PL04 TaxID=3081755 RepID=UPI002981E5B9|nr:ThuA domain-containing protein [Formosa sp. PL04]MDW5288107.1 ThuA domain-containing protein [Formosa sp. PL04]